MQEQQHHLAARGAEARSVASLVQVLFGLWFGDDVLAQHITHGSLRPGSATRDGRGRRPRAASRRPPGRGTSRRSGRRDRGPPPARSRSTRRRRRRRRHRGAARDDPDGADIESTCWLGGDVYVAATAPRWASTTRWPVAARQRPHRRIGTGAGDVEALDQLRRLLADDPPIHQPAPLFTRLWLGDDEEVLGDGEVEDAPGVMAVLGDDGDTGCRHPAGTTLSRWRHRPRCVRSPMRAGWTARRRAPGRPLPSTPAKPTISPLATSTRTRRAAAGAARPAHRGVGDAQHRRATTRSVTSDLRRGVAPNCRKALRSRSSAWRSRVRRRIAHRERHLSPDHRPGQRGGIAVCRGGSSVDYLGRRG